MMLAKVCKGWARLVEIGCGWLSQEMLGGKVRSEEGLDEVA